MKTGISKVIGVFLATLFVSGCAIPPDRAFLDAHAEWQECKRQEASSSYVYCGVEPEWSSWQGR